MARSTWSRYAPAALALCALWGCGDDASTADGGGSTSNEDGGGSTSTPDAAAEVDAGGGSCDMGQMCDFSCGGECTVECLGGRCTAECPAGGCTLDGDFEAVTSYDCAGGGCSIDCDNQSDCTVNCGGGGCAIGCDGDSRCKVHCEGEPCMVSCEAGSIATCDDDNCEIAGCEVCDATDIDDSYMPSLDPADYSPVITNPLFPMTVGAKWVYEAPDEVITIEVLDETYVTATGVECAVVRDQVTTPEGVLIEDTLDWFAQDADGNVWYFGEETAEYVNGVKANTRGAWEAGVDGALPGIIVYGETPEVGTEYRQEYYRCEAEDMAAIVAVGESVTVPAGTYDDCVRIREFSPLDPRGNDHKLLCPGIGVALVEDVVEGGPNEVVETLTSAELP